MFLTQGSKSFSLKILVYGMGDTGSTPGLGVETVLGPLVLVKLSPPTLVVPDLSSTPQPGVDPFNVASEIRQQDTFYYTQNIYSITMLHVQNRFWT